MSDMSDRVVADETPEGLHRADQAALALMKFMPEWNSARWHEVRRLVREVAVAAERRGYELGRQAEARDLQRRIFETTGVSLDRVIGRALLENPTALAESGWTD
jgi:hypothetical protein